MGRHRTRENTVAKKSSKPKNPHAVALGKLGGLKGGTARAESLSDERRSEIAKKAAQSRWKKTVVRQSHMLKEPTGIYKAQVTQITLPTDDSPLLVLQGDTREVIQTIPSESVQCVVTSPPYWGVRDYGVNGQIGAEPVLMDYIKDLVAIFREVRRILKPDGTFWLNIANTYTSGGRTWRQEDEKNKGRGMSYRPPTPEGLKKKDLIGVAWLLALECQKDGWYLRNDIIWNKPNCQPESVRDRLTVSHEYLFLFSKSERYFFDQDTIKEQTQDGKGRKNKRTVWSINTEPCPEAHFAVFPRALVRPCIEAGTRPSDLVLDPFYGAGTVGMVSAELGRLCIGIELKPDYIEIAERRTSSVQSALTL